MIPLMEIKSSLTGRRGVSLPFSDFSEPLLRGPFNGEAIFETLSRTARERRWKHFEIRGRSVIPSGATVLARFYGHRLALAAGADDLLARTGSSVRRAIRKAEASGLSVRIARSREAILQFYALHVRTRRKHGVPPQSKEFFLNIHKHIVEPGLGFIVVASRESRALASAVFFNAGKIALYKFGASDERLQQYRPNNLVMWEGIKYLAESGAKVLHLGRTSPANEGLRRFKMGWGASEETIEYFRYDTARREWITGAPDLPRLATAVFGRLPLAVNRLVGTVVYPHLD